MSRTANATAYHDQLPKKSPVNFAAYIGVLSGIVTIVTAGLGNIAQPYAQAIYGWCLIFIVLSLIVFIYIRERGAQYYLSEYIFYSHYMNHIVRDFVADDAVAAPKELLIKILSAVAESFSVSSGRKCHASIKIYNKKNNEIKYYAYDNSYQIKNGEKDSYPASDFQSIVSILNVDNPRYYLSNNIVRDFYQRKYMHPLLKDFKPEYQHHFSGLENTFCVPKNWPLPFRSTLVVPIRFVPETNSLDDYIYYGFLCVDSVSRNLFDKRYHPEMAAAAADLIYIVMKYMADATEANENKQNLDKISVDYEAAVEELKECNRKREEGSRRRGRNQSLEKTKINI